MNRILSFSAVATLWTVFASGCSLAPKYHSARQVGLSTPTPPAVFVDSPAQSTQTQVSHENKLHLARQLERDGEIEHAKEIYSQVIAKSPQNQMANHRLGVIAANQEQFELAMHKLDIALNSGEPTSELLADIGYICYLAEDLGQAEHKLRMAVNLNPNNQFAYNNLGLVLGDEGRFEESLDAFRQAGSEEQALNNLAYVKSQFVARESGMNVNAVDNDVTYGEPEQPQELLLKSPNTQPVTPKLATLPQLANYPPAEFELPQDAALPQNLEHQTSATVDRVRVQAQADEMTQIVQTRQEFKPVPHRHTDIDVSPENLTIAEQVQSQQPYEIPAILTQKPIADSLQVYSPKTLPPEQNANTIVRQPVVSEKESLRPTIQQPSAVFKAADQNRHAVKPAILTQKPIADSLQAYSPKTLPPEQNANTIVQQPVLSDEETLPPIIEKPSADFKAAAQNLHTIHLSDNHPATQVSLHESTCEHNIDRGGNRTSPTIRSISDHWSENPAPHFPNVVNTVNSKSTPSFDVMVKTQRDPVVDPIEFEQPVRQSINTVQPTSMLLSRIEDTFLSKTVYQKPVVQRPVLQQHVSRESVAQKHGVTIPPRPVVQRGRVLQEPNRLEAALLEAAEKAKGSHSSGKTMPRQADSYGLLNRVGLQ